MTTYMHLENLRKIKLLLSTLDYAELQIIRDIALTQMMQIKTQLENFVNYKN